MSDENERNERMTRRDLVDVLLGGATAGIALTALAGCTGEEGAPPISSTQLAVTSTDVVTVDTIAELRDLDVGFAGQVVFVRGYHSAGDGGGGMFRGVMSDSAADDNGMVIQPCTGTPTCTPSSARWRRIYDGVVSVKYFGAWDDETHESETHAAITAALEFALSASIPTDSHNSGTVVYFPPVSRTDHGRAANYAVDAAIVLPRLPNSHIVLRGGGMAVSAVRRTNAGPLFVPDDDSGNLFDGRYTIEHLGLVAQNDYRCFDWYLDTLVDSSGAAGRPIIHFHEVLFTSAGADSDVLGLVRLYASHRCRFSNCHFFGMKGSGDTSGVAMVFENSGGITLLNCRALSPGAFIRATGGSEIVMINCRTEKVSKLPAYDFENVRHSSLILCTTEGYREQPALFRFTDCAEIVIESPGLAFPDEAYIDEKFADGIDFIGCEACTVIGGVISGSFSGPGDGTARAIYIDSESSYITVIGMRTPASSLALEVENAGTECHVEMLTDSGVQASGTRVAGNMRAKNFHGETECNLHAAAGYAHNFYQDGAFACQFAKDGATTRLYTSNQHLSALSNNNVEVSGKAVSLIATGSTPTIQLAVPGAYRLVANGTGLGFFGATPVGRQPVSGTTDTAALNSLISALVALGLITDAR
jgi:hypothetical protein